MIWRETTQAFISGDAVVVACPRYDEKDMATPFCGGFARLKPGEEGRCPKCDLPLAADEDPRTKKWRGLIPLL